MKLRCTTNSIRMRIRKSELIRLIKEKRVSEHIHFSPQAVLTFTLQIDETTETVEAVLHQHNLIVKLPKLAAEQWMNSNQVGIEVQNLISTEHQLHILIEKDFPCLDRPEEDKTDTFWELAPETPDIC